MRIFNLSLRVNGAELFVTETSNQAAVSEIADNLIKLYKAVSGNTCAIIMRSYEVNGFKILINDLEFAYCETAEHANSLKCHLQKEANADINISVKPKVTFIKETLIK